MQNPTQKHFVCMGSIGNQNGITYVSVLFSLAVLLTMLPFVKFIYQSAVTESYYEELAVSQCFQFIKDETELAERMGITETSLSFTYHDGTNASISQYQNLVRRQVAGQGHETLLRDIRAIQFTAMPYGLQIKITTLTGRDYENKIYLLSQYN